MDQSLHLLVLCCISNMKFLPISNACLVPVSSCFRRLRILWEVRPIGTIKWGLGVTLLPVSTLFLLLHPSECNQASQEASAIDGATLATMPSTSWWIDRHYNVMLESGGSSSSSSCTLFLFRYLNATEALGETLANRLLCTDLLTAEYVSKEVLVTREPAPPPTWFWPGKHLSTWL